jgi:uncharacterized membrane protein
MVSSWLGEKRSCKGSFCVSQQLGKLASHRTVIHSNSTRMNARLQAGRIFYAIGMIAFGVQHLIYGDFVTRIVPSLPSWIPIHAPLAYLCGIVLIVAGCVILARVRVRAAALTLAALIALSVVLLYAPALVAKPKQAGMITSMFKAIALCGGALTLARSATSRVAVSESAINGLLPVGRYLFASFLVVAGIQHFMYSGFVAAMVPTWIPPGQLFWTYFAGAALIAGGVGIVFSRTTRWAATLVGAMIFLWVFLLHIPRAVADLHNSNETTAVFEAVAMSGIAFMIAGLAITSRRR